jgi:hypothetical protein
MYRLPVHASSHDLRICFLALDGADSALVPAQYVYICPGPHIPNSCDTLYTCQFVEESLALPVLTSRPPVTSTSKVGCNAKL